MNDHYDYVSIGARRHGRLVDLPVDARLKARLGRAVTNALMTTSGRSTPPLRRAVDAVVDAMRVQGFTDEGIRARLAMLIQAIALDGGLDAGSILSGRPRWQELSDRVAEWVGCLSS